jgi:glycosyltransferase involved in cell wall biosynthesis
MKILHLISSGGLYGAETMVLTLSKRLQEQGHTSVIGVFLNLHSPNTEIADRARSSGVPVEVVPCKGRIDGQAVRRLRRLIRDQRVDAVHAHGYKADIYGYAANFGLRTPILSTCHTWYDNDVTAYLYGVLDRRILRWFDMTIAVSEAVAATLRDAGVSPKKITIINNGIDLHLFSSCAATLRSELRTHKKIIGTVARLAPEKGIEYLLQAAAVVLRRQPHVLFVIVGDGPNRRQLETLAQELGINGHVIFTGARRDMPGVYASLDVLVQPSLKEGLPMTLLEALASKRATVATRVGAVPRVVLHEKTGLLIEPADSSVLAAAILRLLADDNLRDQLSETGYAWVRQNFSAEGMAQTYLELYQSMTRKQYAYAQVQG